MSPPTDPHVAPDSPEVHWRRAEQQLQAGDCTAASASCLATLALAPQHSGAHLMLSNVYGQVDRHRLAPA